MQTLSLDFLFMAPSGHEEAPGLFGMLAVKPHDSPMTFSHVVDRRGSVDSKTRRFVAHFDWVGLFRHVFTSQKPANFGFSRCDAHSCFRDRRK